MHSRLSHRLAVSAFFFICGCIFASWASRIPSVKDTFRLNEAQLGALLFMLPLGSVAGLPVAGWSIAKFGSRAITFSSAIFYSIVLLGIGLCDTVTQLSVMLFLLGFSGDILNIAMNVQALQVQEKLYSKPLMSSFHALWSIGAMIGALVGGWMMRDKASLEQHFLVVAIASAIISVFFLFYLLKKDPPRQSQKLFAWPDKALWLVVMICFCCTICEGAMADWSSLYYRQVTSDITQVSTTGYTAFAFTMAFGRLVGDKIINAFGYRTALLVDGLLITLGLLLAIAVPSPIAVIMGFSLVGFGVSTVIPIVYTFAGQNKTMPPSVALAAVSTIGFTGFLIGPPIIGFIAHETSLRIALLLIVLLGIMIGVLSRRISR